MKKQIYDIVFSAQYEGLSTKEATDKLLLLFSVSERSKQLFCPKCKDQNYLVHEKEYECLMNECRHKWAK